jgi:hypothetical protein
MNLGWQRINRSDREKLWMPVFLSLLFIHSCQYLLKRSQEEYKRLINQRFGEAKPMFNLLELQLQLGLQLARCPEIVLAEFVLAAFVLPG